MTITRAPTQRPAELPTPHRTTTTIAVDAAPGNVRVHHRAESTGSAPRIRPVVLATGPGFARISMVPEGALLLAGDDISITVTVGPGVRLELVEPAGTVAYDMRGGTAQWRVDAAVADGGSLIWHGEPFVVAEGARVRRELHATIEPGAALALREVLALGRDGELGGEIDQTCRIERPDGTPILVDGLRVARGQPGIGLGDARVLTTITLLGQSAEIPAGSTAMLSLEQGGALWRAMADHAHLVDEADLWSSVVSQARS